ncbi:MAG: TRAP transporter small permease [Rectinema sp.]|jgi:TRAP-type C4-dicarboxylate transport system permease small subunit|uniref:Tripartite ATP-independent periplasmic transporter DctQ component n=1 Tax=uncultured spirochete TaxID=156406 RepID=A0A3P3XR68_9SPIR|nr:Tripartite ATP-independent periplasmic transporter DctQ component [uncultured spirochete]
MAKTFYVWFDRIRTVMLISISSFTVILCFIQIVLRYFTFLSLRPFAWGDEVLRLCAIWVIFLGISLGVRKNAHFRVDLFLNKIKSPKARQVVDTIIDALVMMVLILLTYYGGIYAMSNITSSLQNIDMSMAWFYAAIPVGCIFEIIEYIYKLAYGKDYPEKMFPQKQRVTLANSSTK